MPKFYLELFKTLILEFVYIHSKRRKLGMFILFQKCQFFYPKKIDSIPIHPFPSFTIFGHVTVIKREAKETSRFTFGENSFCSKAPSEKYCQSFICFVPVVRWSPGNQLEYEQLRSKPSSLLLISEDELISKINSKIKDDNKHLGTRLVPRETDNFVFKESKCFLRRSRGKQN